MYDAEISRSNPTTYVFLIDQSASMGDLMPGGGSKAAFVADVINRTLRDLVIRCSREEGIRDYFDVAVIGYGDKSVRNELAATLGPQWMHPISAVADSTVRVEDRPLPGGGSGETVKFPVWLDATSAGGTPMQAALATCAQIVADWSDTHLGSFPATVLHITDGESTDGDPEHNASILRSLSTNDGSTLMYNIHVTSAAAQPLRYPTGEGQLPNSYSKMLFRMSSTFPEHVRQYARDAHGLELGADARAMILNADAEELVKFLDIGSRPAAMR